MKKKMLAMLLAVTCVMSAALYGCSSAQPETQPSTTAAQQTQPQTTQAPVDQSKEIVFAASRDQCPGEEDAYYAIMTLGIWEPLIAKGEDGKPYPALATKWEHNEDSTVWTFHLREGVTFSNGTPFNADIVLANFDRMKKGPFSSSFYGLNIETLYPGLVSYEKTDDYTVVLTLSEGQPLLDYTMVNYGSAMFEPSCFADDGTFNGFAIGTGPFVVKENVLGQYCVTERNENYWGTPAKAKTMRFKVIPDADIRYSALRAGEVQGLCDLGAISPAQAAEIANDPAYNVSVGESTITHFLNVNGGSFPFDDVRMRQGLSLLLDRKTIIDGFFNGYGIAAGGFLTYASPFQTEQPVVTDPQKGMDLIRQVVGDQPVELKFLLPSVDVNRYPYQEVAEYIQSLLENIEGTNIKVNIQTLDWGPCKDEMKAGNYNMCLKIQGLPSANPLSLFKGFMYTDGGTNIAYGLGYHNDQVDALIDEASACLDVARLTEIYTELQQIAAQDLPNIPVLYSQEVVASSSKITGYQAADYALIGLTQVCWAE